ncbi:type I-D CRISPR-associated helicase Cas3' [Flammeovirga sp. EKP202]|uniref:type I-D CRISPR-associated helicase Cas3' n=1 Tax=Flammeovirga sp. EKP202 TaxID=2770592 RepID=UPI00165F120B|nr:type I-D CRISPR-associated helicase Cas3' [Flammeovirga sp. EKP202]MBD0405056.1 type I-D CRISPR-associated helicase Cas3' [Flammeovirga sp. EKP202]
MISDNVITLKLSPQYVKQTEVKEKFYTRDGIFEGYMHKSQLILRDQFDTLPLYTFLYAPTGTGKSYGFVFPVLKDRGLNKKKGLLILPTNTLIDELHENFSITFKGLKINKLTGQSLDEAEKKGSKNRWEYCLELAESSDILITNPDILNYAMHGGYDKNIKKSMDKWLNQSWKNSGGKTVIHFLKRFDFFVFDEFHLYDEEQIANILTLTKLRECFIRNSARFLFVSATPERKLEQVLESENVTIKDIEQCLLDDDKKVNKNHYTILEEKIIQDAVSSRKIRGGIEVKIVKSDSFLEVIINNVDEVVERVKKGEKVLIIFNALHQLNHLKSEIEELFGEERIRVVTGYHQLQESDNDKPIILATSKVEVGANFGVDYGLMQTGFNSRSFIQRFGRYARGGKEGKVVIHYDSSLKGGNKSMTTCFTLLKKALTNSADQLDHLDYNTFVDAISVSMDDPKFYKEKVPLLYGEYLFSVFKNFKENNNYESVKIFEEELSKYLNSSKLPEKTKERYSYYLKINSTIYHLSKQYPQEGKEWSRWWNDYLETYLTFKGSIPIVKVIDLDEGGLETQYSIEWILTHKDIIEEKEVNGERIIVVDRMLESRNTDIQYEVVTMPYIGAEQYRFLDFKEREKPSDAFKKRLKLLGDKGTGRSISPFRVEQKKLVTLLKGLIQTFSEKRFKVVDVRGSDRNFI